MTRLLKAWPLVLAALTVSPGTAAAADDTPEAEVEKRIEIYKVVHQDCEGDCDESETHRRVIVVGDGEEIELLGGDPTTHLPGHLHPHVLPLLDHGKGGFLGVATTELTPELRSHFGVPEEAGVLVARVVDDSAAARAGVQVGDVLTAVGGEAIESTGDLLRTVRGHQPGAAVDLEVWRDGVLQTLDATLGERRRPHRLAAVRGCADDGGECPQIADLDCGGDEECRVEIRCGDSGCECTVNGEATECETLPGFAAPGE